MINFSHLIFSACSSYSQDLYVFLLDAIEIDHHTATGSRLDITGGWRYSTPLGKIFRTCRRARDGIDTFYCDLDRSVLIEV